jgi:ABC-type polysaccharide/polyol phosphate transport system ATPase subunit
VTAAAVQVDGLSKRFKLYRERNQSLKAALMRGKRASFEEFWALRDVSFEIPVGSTFGLIGENGSGKSTLLKCIAHILQADTGSVQVNGRIAALLELGSGFHQELSGRENVYLNGSILGLGKKELERKFDEIVDFAGIEEFIDQPVKNYSSGMYVRLGFAIAINVDPDILLVDEVLAVGDAAFQEKCMDKFAEFRRRGKTVVIVSHAMGSLRSMCDRAVWLEHGHLIREGRANEIVDGYLDSTFQTRADEVIDVSQPDDVADGGGEPMMGSGEVMIKSVAMVDGSGRRRDRFRTGDQVTIRLQYSCSRDIENASFGYALENADGVYVWAHSTIDSGYQIERLTGDGTIDLVIPGLPLQPGTFDLTATVANTNSHVFHLVRHCLRFHVDFGTPRESGGIVVFSGEWTQPAGSGRDDGERNLRTIDV